MRGLSSGRFGGWSRWNFRAYPRWYAASHALQVRRYWSRVLSHAKFPTGWNVLHREHQFWPSGASGRFARMGRSSIPSRRCFA